MVTIIGQIKQWGFSNARTTCFMKRIERGLSSSRRLINLGDVGVCPEMICDIANGSVNHSSSANCHNRKSGCTGRDASKQHPTTQTVLCNGKARLYFRETSISFFWVCGYNKLKELTEGDLVSPDVAAVVLASLSILYRLRSRQGCCLSGGT